MSVARLLACATCVASAYGDRTFNWAYVALLLLPFALVAIVAGVFAWHAGYRPRMLLRHPPARPDAGDHPDIIKETT